MAVINPQELNHLLFKLVQIGIQDLQGDERTPFVEKTIVQIEVCPDGTHLRFYFNAKKFLAVPMDADFSASENEWSAYDNQSGLNYIIRKG